TPRASTFYCDIASEYIIPSIEREALELDRQLAVERAQQRLRDEAERNAQVRVANRLRLRLYAAIFSGTVAALLALGFAYLSFELKAKTAALEESLKSEQSLKEMLQEKANKLEGAVRSGDVLRKQPQVAIVGRDEALKGERAERARAIAGELGQSALNKLSGDPDASVLLALQSAFVARRAGHGSPGIYTRTDPETYGV